VPAIPDFFDDFSKPELARYYEFSPGIGQLTRGADGVHYLITRAPDGAANSGDRLSIDSLGRPSSPTAKAVLRFRGDEWTVEIAVEYGFQDKRNGRHACFWIVGGEPADRFSNSVAVVRSADLTPESHGLSVTAYGKADPVSVPLSQTPAACQSFRISRLNGRTKVFWREDVNAFSQVLESELAPSPVNSIVLNSSSFAGGASFVLRSLRLLGGHVIEAPAKPPSLRRSGGVISAEELAQAIRERRDIDLKGCVVDGSLDFGHVPSPVACDIHFEECRFTSPLRASGAVRVLGSLSCVGCEFIDVGLSSVDFSGPLRFVGCRFRGDARFIETLFREGANFSASSFARRPFFRIARAGGPVSFYHATFEGGADISSAVFYGDLSLSDIAVLSGSVTLHQSQVRGTVRLMATLQRDPQPLGNEIDFSASTLEALVISSGDRRNLSEYTGSARWRCLPVSSSGKRLEKCWSSITYTSQKYSTSGAQRSSPPQSKTQHSKIWLAHCRSRQNSTRASSVTRGWTRRLRNACTRSLSATA
jgi:hypothetical protein